MVREVCIFEPIVFSGRALLADWWYWAGKIAKEQSRLAKINDARTSRRLRKLYRIRKRRFRHAVNAMIKMIVEYAHQVGISKIIVGDLKGIRENNHSNSKANSMIHNFWSYKYIIQRLKDKAEEHGIEVIEVNEYKTSSICPRCGSEKVVKRGRLLKCLKCGLEAHRDVAGVLNIALVHDGGGFNGVVAHPLLLRWDGMKWEPKRAMNTRPMNTLEAENLPASAGRVSSIGLSPDNMVRKILQKLKFNGRGMRLRPSLRGLETQILRLRYQMLRLGRLSRIQNTSIS